VAIYWDFSRVDEGASSVDDYWLLLIPRVSMDSYLKVIHILLPYTIRKQNRVTRSNSCEKAMCPGSFVLSIGPWWWCSSTPPSPIAHKPQPSKSGASNRQAQQWFSSPSWSFTSLLIHLLGNLFFHQSWRILYKFILSIFAILKSKIQQKNSISNVTPPWKKLGNYVPCTAWYIQVNAAGREVSADKEDVSDAQLLINKARCFVASLL
jgi:hypothetical protein